MYCCMERLEAVSRSGSPRYMDLEGYAPQLTINQGVQGVFGAVRACQKLPPELLGQRDLAIAPGYPSHQKPDLGVVAFRWLRKGIRHVFRCPAR